MSKFQQQMETRSHIRKAIDQLRSDGVTIPQLIEAMRNELQLLHIEDDRNAEASTKDLHRPGAGSSPTTATNER